MARRRYRAPQMADILASAIGWVLSIPGLIALLVFALRTGDSLHVASSVVYGTSLFVSYAAFTLYHVFEFHPRWGTLFKILDHAVIFLFIAGTYTPFTLVDLRGHWGWTLFIVVWTLALAGVVFKIFFVYRFRILAPLFYLFMGWLILFDMKSAVEFIPRPAMDLLLTGGVVYTGGILFYLWKKFRFHHAIWHLFVLAGSACHYFAILYFVIS